MSQVITLEMNPLNELHRNIIKERARRKSQNGSTNRSVIDKLERIEAAKVLKDTIVLER